MNPREEVIRHVPQSTKAELRGKVAIVSGIGIHDYFPQGIFSREQRTEPLLVLQNPCDKAALYCGCRSHHRRRWPSTLPQSIEAVKIGGHIAMIGILGGMDAVIPMIPVFPGKSGFKVVSTVAGRTGSTWSNFWPRKTSGRLSIVVLGLRSCRRRSSTRNPDHILARSSSKSELIVLPVHRNTL